MQKLVTCVYIVRRHTSTMVNWTLFSVIAIRYLMFPKKILNFENDLLATFLTYLTKLLICSISKYLYVTAFFGKLCSK